MALFRPHALKRWLSAPPGNGSARPRRPRSCRPAVEAFEDRWLPAQLIWTGNDPNSPNWNDANNWKDAVTGNPTAPNPGDDLTFNSTATRFFSNNDFPDGTAFGAFTISEPSSSITGTAGYSITGNGINVTSMSVNEGGGVLDAIGLSLQGSARLTKDGAGSLSLSGANTYSDGTNLIAGTLIVTNNNSLGTGTTSPLTIFGGAIRCSASPVTFSSATGVKIAGNVTFGGTAPITFNEPISLAASPDLVVNNPSVTFAGVVSESFPSLGLTKDGAGTLDLEGVNGYTGPTTLNAGTLIAGNSSALGVSNGNGQHQLVLDGGTLGANSTPITLDHPLTISGPVTVGGGQNVTFTGAAALLNSPRITLAFPGVTTTLNGQVSDGLPGQSLFKDGPGTLVLGTANAYTGNTFLLAGTLVVGNDAALGTSGTLFLDGGTITADGNSHQLANAVTFAADTTFGGLGGTLTFTGATTLVVSNHTATVIDPVVFLGNIGQSGGNFGLTVTGPPTGVLQLAGTNAFAGGITLNGRATLFLNSDGALGSGPLTLSGGSVINGSDRTVPNNVAPAGSVTFEGGTNLTFTGPLSLTTLVAVPTVRLFSGTTVTFAGTVTGAGPLIKDGPGSLVVSGPSPASLNTVVLNGVIAGRNAGQLGSLTAAGGVASPGVDVSPGGFAIDGLAGPGTLTVNGNLALTGASTFTALVNGPGTQYDQIVVGGTVAVGGQLQVLLNFSPAVGTAFTLIKNNGSSPVQGFFTGLPEGPSS
jgi:autotransporter-associated beta strand protein